MKKGFTLIELLAVITLIAIVIGFAFPAIMNRINADKEKIDSALTSTIEASANLYIQNNKSKFNDNTVHYIKFQTLVNNELLDSSVLNDYRNYCVKAIYSSNQYTYEIVSTCVEG